MDWWGIFGGMLALHMAEQVQPRGVILIGSVAQSRSIPLYIRLLATFAGGRHLSRPFAAGNAHAADDVDRGQALAAHLWISWQMRRANPRVIRWSIRKLLEWSRSLRSRAPSTTSTAAATWFCPPATRTPIASSPAAATSSHSRIHKR